jgi:hypothetical protein
MASSTSYHSVHRVRLISLCPDPALFVAHVRFAIIVFDHGRDDCILLRFY